MIRPMSLEAIEIETGPAPTATIIVLHGLGADGNDFVPFADEIDLRSKGDVRWIFPNAPTMPVTINGGYVMRAWYDVLGPDIARREDEAGLRRSASQVQALIDQERARGVPAHRIVLGGFSQGCAMSLLTGLRYPERLGGLIGMSGYLPLADTLAAERSPANADLPIFLAHGHADPVIPFERAVASRDVLLSLGYPVEWHEYAMQHSVCPQEVYDLQKWLLRIL
jgi:phospholipase/carboxylesterase